MWLMHAQYPDLSYISKTRHALIFACEGPSAAAFPLTDGESFLQDMLASSWVDADWSIEKIISTERWPVLECLTKNLLRSSSRAATLRCCKSQQMQALLGPDTTSLTSIHATGRRNLPIPSRFNQREWSVMVAGHGRGQANTFHAGP